MAAPDQIAIVCPDCGSEILLDRRTGEILSHRAPKATPAGGKSLDSLFADLESAKAKAEDRFEQERAAMADRERLLEEKFKQAMKRADEEPDAPIRKPVDFE
jgi:hypothetical protein